MNFDFPISGLKCAEDSLVSMERTSLSSQFQYCAVSKKPASEIIDLKRVVFPTWRGPINIIIFPFPILDLRMLFKSR